MESLIQGKGGKILDYMQLKKILVKPMVDKNDIKVTRIIWQNRQTGKTQMTPINSLYLSLGPSMKSMTVNFSPEVTSFSAMLQKVFGIPFGSPQNLIGQMMWAAASSIVFMVRVDCSRVDNESKKHFFMKCLH